MPVTQDKPGPYAPASAILDVVSRYRNRGLPFPVNGEVLGRAGISESLIPRTLQALQTLDLIKDTGNPTDTLEGLRLAPEADYKRYLGEWVKSAYADVFKFVDPATDDESRIRDAFRTYNPIGQQGRMVTTFQGLCAAAGLISDKQPSAPRAHSSQPRARAVGATVIVPRTPKVHWSKVASKAPAGSLPPAIAGLLESLPSDGWTAAERDKFLITFKAVLDFAVPVVTTKKKSDDPDEG